MGYWTPGEDLRAAASGAQAVVVRDRWPAGAGLDAEERVRRIGLLAEAGISEVVVAGGAPLPPVATVRVWTEVPGPAEAAEALLGGVRALRLELAREADLAAVADVGRLATSAGALLDVVVPGGPEAGGTVARLRAVLPPSGRVTVAPSDAAALGVLVARTGPRLTVLVPVAGAGAVVATALAAGVRRFEADRDGASAGATAAVVAACEDAGLRTGIGLSAPPTGGRR